MDVTEATFEQDVIARSHEVPVVVDFWAAWCGPCRQLAPLIEAAVARRDGEVELAKVDIDSNPNLARRYRVMSIPFVAGFKGGEAVAEFVGAQLPQAIDRFLDGLVPSQADRLVEEGDETSLREAILREPGHTRARLELARLLLAEGRSDEIAEILDPIAFDPGAAGILARVRLSAVDQPDVAAGIAALDSGLIDPGLTHLLDAIRVAPVEILDDIRATMVGVFAELGDQHPLTMRFRRRLARSLY